MLKSLKDQFLELKVCTVLNVNHDKIIISRELSNLIKKYKINEDASSTNNIIEQHKINKKRKR